MKAPKISIDEEDFRRLTSEAKPCHSRWKRKLEVAEIAESQAE
jgi:hypothetical protein